MPKVVCQYYSTVYSVINKKDEVFTMPGGATVEDMLSELLRRYGTKLEQHLYSEGWTDGKHYKTAAVYVNKKRIQWMQDFPEGLKTKLKDGDVLSLGLIMGGG